MSSKIVVTGLGIISAIGNNVEETFDALTNKRSGIKPVSILDTIHKNKFLVGEIPLSHNELIAIANVSGEEPWTRTALLGIIAARQAMIDAGIDNSQNQRTGLVSATTVGGMDRSELFYKNFLSEETFNPFIDTHHAGDSTEKIAENLQVTDYITTISTACSSSLNSIMFGARLIKNGIVDRVIAGGTDALSKFTLNGFNTLMILDKNRCRPFDATRTGLNLGEGAAYIVLEKEESAIRNNKKIYAGLSGYANANDAFHQTASSDDGKGPYLAMSNALKKAKLNPAKIDYINVHGTGTDNNDLTEGKAMLRLFGDAFPPFSSTKAYTGHTLGAAGAVESIISILSLTNDKIFPNIGFSQPIDETGLIPVTSVKEKNLQHVLTNSFGFGGNDSSLVFSKWNENQEPGSRSQDSELKTQDSKLKTQDSGLETQDSGLETQDSRLKTPIYINGLGAVTPQDTLNESYLEEVTSYQENFLQIKKPNYRDFINPKVLRRMSKIVRMGIVSSKIAMEDAGIKQPDAIITGTGMGCQADTEKFLNSMLDNNEQLLNPTAFIQSTHNTTGAQIALMLGNNYYNFAYVHRTFSFESALLDSMMLIRNNEAENILLGGIDEITEESWLIKTRIGYYKKNTSNNLEILSDDQEGALAGESAAFFMLSDQRTDNSYAQVTGVDTFFKPDGPTIIEKRINAFLTQHEMEPEDVDLVLMGYNGDLEFDTVYKEVEEKTFNKQDIGYFKHLCGEHDTASSFAMWIAARILKTGSVPEIILNKNINTEKPKTVLIYNHFRNINHSLILLKKA